MPENKKANSTTILDFHGNTIRQRADGMWSLNDIAKAKKKELRDILELEPMKAYIKAVQQDTGRNSTSIRFTDILDKRSYKGGTWGITLIALEVARLCDADLSVFLNKYILGQLNQSVPGLVPNPDKRLLAELMARKRNASAHIAKLFLAERPHISHTAAFKKYCVDFAGNIIFAVWGVDTSAVKSFLGLRTDREIVKGEWWKHLNNSCMQILALAYEMVPRFIAALSQCEDRWCLYDKYQAFFRECEYPIPALARNSRRLQQNPLPHRVLGE